MPKRRPAQWFRILIPDIIEALRNKDLGTVKKFLTDLMPVDVVEILERLPPTEQAVMFRLLPKEKAADVLSEMSKDMVESLVENLTSKEVKEIFASMDPDDRVRLLDELPASLVEKVISSLPKGKRDEIVVLLNYPAGSAGHRMRPEFARIKGDMVVKDAISYLRKKPYDEELLREIYVTGPKRELLGVITLPRLVKASPKEKVKEIMKKTPFFINAHDHQEKAAKIMKDYDLINLPVVDSEGRILGILTIDDIMDVIEEEATEDIHKLGGMGSPEPEEEYHRLTIIERVKKRIPWLVTLLILELITATVIKNFDKLLNSAIFLSYFIPMLIGTGGNTGTQSVTLTVRAIALGEIEIMHFLKVLLRELLTGIWMGTLLGIVGASVAFVIVKSLRVSSVVFLGLLSVVLFSNAFGIILPFIFKKLRIDPAVSSSPLITTLIDIGGLFLYFSIAMIML